MLTLLLTRQPHSVLNVQELPFSLEIVLLGSKGQTQLISKLTSLLSSTLVAGFNLSRYFHFFSFSGVAISL